MLVPIKGDYALFYTAKDGLRVKMLHKVTPRRLHWMERGGFTRSLPREALVALFDTLGAAERALQSARGVAGSFRDREHRNDVEFAQAVARYKAEAERIENIKLAELKRHAPKWVVR